MAEYRDYLVPWPPEEVLDRLRKQAGPENILGCLDSTDRAVVGRVEDRRFRLRVPRGFTSNLFAPYLYGWIEPRPGGTRIRTRLSMTRFATGLIVVWVGALLMSSLIGLLKGDGAQCFGCLGMAVIFLWFTRLSRWMDRAQEESLHRFAASVFADDATSARDPGLMRQALPSGVWSKRD
jgi:hypothetical protein